MAAPPSPNRDVGLAAGEPRRLRARVSTSDAAALLSAAGEIARDEGLGESGYRLVFNTGAGAQQTVFHTHLHLLGGRPFSWPPG